MPAYDLSVCHDHLTGLFRNPVVQDNTASPADKTFFDKHGYLSGIRLLNDEQIGDLRTALDRLMTRGDDPRYYEFNLNESTDTSKVLFHALGAWRISEEFHDLVFFRPIAAMAESLLGGRVRFWHDQLFVKPPFDGGIVAWHQDYSYWTRTKPLGHITCWIALDDSSIENGCLHYVPGSHKWGLLPRTGLSDDMTSVIEHLDEVQKAAFDPVPIELAAGEASFHHAMTVHGSYENRSDRPRRGVVINLFLDGVLSDSDEPLLSGVPPIPRGGKIEGRFFPLLSAVP